MVDGKIDGPVAQLHLLGAIIDDHRCRIVHAKVGRIIIARYYAKYGSGRASVGYLATATGLTRGTVADATADLVDWGYFTRVMGAGKRPTEYTPIWRSVLTRQDATIVLQPQDAAVPPPQDARPDTVLQPPDQTCLPVPAYKAGLRDKQDADSAAPTAPLAAALGGTAAGAAGFDELYDAYAVRTKRAEARAAYNKLAPSADLHATLVEAAARWRRAYDDIGRAPEYRKELRNWLTGECWLEDPPVARAERPAKRKKPAAPAPGVVRRDITITGVEEDRWGDALVSVAFNDEVLPADDPAATLRFRNSRQGVAEYKALQVATNNTELVGSRVYIDLIGGNDDEGEDGVPERWESCPTLPTTMIKVFSLDPSPRMWDFGLQ